MAAAFPTSLYLRRLFMKKIEEYVRSIPDFPEPGIIFRDVTSILQDADGLKLAIDSMQDRTDVPPVVEARGIVLGFHVFIGFEQEESGQLVGGV